MYRKWLYKRQGERRNSENLVTNNLKVQEAQEKRVKR